MPHHWQYGQIYDKRAVPVDSLRRAARQTGRVTGVLYLGCSQLLPLGATVVRMVYFVGLAWFAQPRLAGFCGIPIPFSTAYTTKPCISWKVTRDTHIPGAGTQMLCFERIWSSSAALNWAEKVRIRRIVLMRVQPPHHNPRAQRDCFSHTCH